MLLGLRAYGCWLRTLSFGSRCVLFSKKHQHNNRRCSRWPITLCILTFDMKRALHLETDLHIYRDRAGEHNRLGEKPSRTPLVPCTFNCFPFLSALFWCFCGKGCTPLRVVWWWCKICTTEVRAVTQPKCGRSTCYSRLRYTMNICFGYRFTAHKSSRFEHVALLYVGPGSIRKGPYVKERKTERFRHLHTWYLLHAEGPIILVYRLVWYN